MSTSGPFSREEVQTLLEIALLHPVLDLSRFVLNGVLTSGDASNLLADAIARKAVDADISQILSAVLKYGHLDVIVSLLRHERSDVRRTTAVSLRWVWDTRVVDPLLECSTSDVDDQVRAAARRALDTIPKSAKQGSTLPLPSPSPSDLALARRIIEWSRDGGTDDIVAALNDRTLSPALRRLLCSILMTRTTDELITAIGGLKAPLKEEFIANLGRRGDPRVIPFLEGQFDTGDASAIMAVGRALEELGGAASLRALVNALGHGDYRVQDAVQFVLPKFGKAGIDALVQIVESGPQPARLPAIEVLAKFHDLTAFAAIARVAATPSDQHRSLAVRKLVRFSNSRSTAIFADALRSDDASVRQEAARALASQRSIAALQVVAAALMSDVTAAADAAIDGLKYERWPEAWIRQWIEDSPEPARSRLQAALRSWESPPVGGAFASLPDLSAGSERPAYRMAPPDTAVRQPRPIDSLPPFDLVRFSAIAPATVKPGSSFVIELWAHLEELADQVATRAREARAGQPIHISSRGPLRVPQASDIRARLSVPTFNMAGDEDTIVWTGTIGNATFPVLVPRDSKAGTHVAEFLIFVGALQAARLHLEIEVAPAASTGDCVPAQRRLLERRVEKAFASYASEDRSEVLARVQGIVKALPGIDIFIDLVSLRAGEHWEKRIAEEILTRDVFYLFWSIAASRSPWVDKEWRTALMLRGIDYIDPVPLQLPALAPPPPELSDLHFNDWTLVVSRRSGNYHFRTELT